MRWPWSIEFGDHKFFQGQRFLVPAGTFQTLLRKWDKPLSWKFPLGILVKDFWLFLAITPRKCENNSGKTPLERVHKILSKFDSIRRSRECGSVALENENDLFHKFMGQVESIFKNLPKPLKWQFFLLHDLVLLTGIPSKVQKASVKRSLNKSKI